MRAVRALTPAVVLVGALTLVACGGGGGGSDDATETDGATRTVEHALGTAEVPAEPERVVVLDTGELDSALALGVTPVGAVELDSAAEYLTYLADRTEGIEDVGTIAEPALERIAALRPDLILTNAVRHEDIYPQLSEIAPTVVAPDVGVSWKDNLRLAGQALGREDRAEELLADYETRAAEVGEQVGAGTTVSLVRFLGDSTRLYSDRSFPGVVLTDMGLQVPEGVRGEDTFVELSGENLDDADAEVLLLVTSPLAAEDDVAAITGNPVWQGLPAVQEDRVVEVGDDLVSGIGVLAADGLLDAIERGAAA